MPIRPAAARTVRSDIFGKTSKNRLESYIAEAERSDKSWCGARIGGISSRFNTIGHHPSQRRGDASQKGDTVTAVVKATEVMLAK
jgi:hypothetical protein